MNDHLAPFIGALIAIVGMFFAFVMGYLMGYSDAKTGRGFNRE